MRRVIKCDGRAWNSTWISKTHLHLWLVGIVLSFLHGRGHLVHGGDDGTAGLPQTFWTTLAESTVNLVQKQNRNIKRTYLHQPNVVRLTEVPAPQLCRRYLPV